jgi:glycine oxidase
MMAYALAKGGAQVSLYDRGGEDGEHAAATIAAAMLAPLAESAITEANVVQMGMYSLPRWQAFTAELHLPVFFQQEGTVFVWHQQDAIEAKRLTAQLVRNCRESQQAGASTYPLEQPQQLDRHALEGLEPSLADRFHQGLFLPHEGQLDNRQLLVSLLHALGTMHVGLHWNHAIDPDDLHRQGKHD